MTDRLTDITPPQKWREVDKLGILSIVNSQIVEKLKYRFYQYAPHRHFYLRSILLIFAKCSSIQYK